uniref:(2E,6E)-farnesyl diphosphate synthase n=1 Tax=Candidatus Aschnera chinzeii TaxID=1485666 RepID=A0AAT9G4F8_9ENTR|nr:MAG: (2E,6E)-farnesyl diphosphate synthase [Candidatus Aschnera chinzeii]
MTLAISLLSFTEQLKWVQERVNKILLHKFQRLPNHQSKLIRAMQYSTLIGGKRIRPFLIYIIGNMLNISIKNLDIPAAAIECIHTYSLIHDDLPAMDNGIYRRGKHTCHLIFDEAHAILAGDALHALAFEMLSNSTMPDINDSNKLTIINELAHAIGASGMCGGQALDIESIHQEINVEKLNFIYFNKTGALIRAAIKICIIAANIQNCALSSLLETYANTFGLLFQIKDDLKDYQKDKCNIKQQNFSNTSSKLKTYPTLIGIKKTNRKITDLYHIALKTLEKLENIHGINTTTLQNLTHFIAKKNIPQNM